MTEHISNIGTSTGDERPSRGGDYCCFNRVTAAMVAVVQTSEIGRLL